MRTRLSAVVGVCLILVAGCSPTLSDSRVLVAGKSDGTLNALFRGEVRMVGGCLGMEDTVVIWPYGTRVVDRDPLTIDVPGTGRVRVGQKVSLGGGMVLEQSDAGEVPDPIRLPGGTTVPKRCAKHGIWGAN